MTDKIPWKLTWQVRKLVSEDEGGEVQITTRSWTEADLTGEHLAQLAILHNDPSWAPLDRGPTSGPIDLLAYLAVFVASASGRDINEVRVELAQASAADLLAAVSVD